MKRMDMEAVERRLTDEARQIRGLNGFSPALHQRIMESLRRRGLGVSDAAAARNPWLWRAALPLGLAAAVALGAWLIVRAPDQPIKAPTNMANNNDVPPLPRNLVPVLDSRVAAPTTSALEERKYAYLDRDAQRLLLFVADQIPDFPQSK